MYEQKKGQLAITSPIKLPSFYKNAGVCATLAGLSIVSGCETVQLHLLLI